MVEPEPQLCGGLGHSPLDWEMNVLGLTGLPNDRDSCRLDDELGSNGESQAIALAIMAGKNTSETGQAIRSTAGPITLDLGTPSAWGE